VRDSEDKNRRRGRVKGEKVSGPQDFWGGGFCGGVKKERTEGLALGGKEKNPNGYRGKTNRTSRRKFATIRERKGEHSRKKIDRGGRRKKIRWLNNSKLQERNEPTGP